MTDLSGFLTWIELHGRMKSSTYSMVRWAEVWRAKDVETWTDEDVRAYLARPAPAAGKKDSGAAGSSKVTHALKLYFAYKSTVSTDRRFVAMARLLEQACPSTMYWKLQLTYMGVLT